MSPRILSLLLMATLSASAAHAQATAPNPSDIIAKKKAAWDLLHKKNGTGPVLDQSTNGYVPGSIPDVTPLPPTQQSGPALGNGFGNPSTLETLLNIPLAATGPYPADYKPMVDGVSQPLNAKKELLDFMASKQFATLRDQMKKYKTYEEYHRVMVGMTTGMGGSYLSVTMWQMVMDIPALEMQLRKEMPPGEKSALQHQYLSMLMSVRQVLQGGNLDSLRTVVMWTNDGG